MENELNERLMRMPWVARYVKKNKIWEKDKTDSWDIGGYKLFNSYKISAWMVLYAAKG